MTRNQKIAIGCGGAGCLGLIVVVIAGVLLYYFGYQKTYLAYRNNNDNFNATTNRNSNSNDNLATNDNDNDNSSSSSTSADSMSDDDKHKLYQAAIQTGDAQLLQRVEIKLGLREDDYTPGDKYEAFVTEHVTWVFRNGSFVNSINTPEKARAYVDQNFPD